MDKRIPETVGHIILRCAPLVEVGKILFLTGNYQLRNFRGNANSYAWYLREQGYAIEGSHPYYQWFYNRFNINGYLGFETYRFLEGDYETMSHSS